MVRNLTATAFILPALCVGLAACTQDKTNVPAEKPNIILIMADDLGWGDVGFNGNKVVKTPELDKMAAGSIQFSRFYAAAPVCSPTRGSCLTGRSPERYGISFANVGHMKKEEVTMAEVLKTKGYVTGHFGKWHLGTLSKTIKDGRRGGRDSTHYSPPWENGFDVCFSTEVAIPTWDPMKDQAFESKYWTGPGRFAESNLEGDDSRVIMDRALPFMMQAALDKQPFLSVIWFHAPHSPVVAGPEYRKLYGRYDENKQHYYGCITAMDEQIGRLRSELRRLKIAENTLILFASDNGPAGKGGGILQEPGARQQGSAGPFRGRKGSLYEGGIRVPALLEWPALIKSHREVQVPLCTSDYFPTIMGILGDEGKGPVLPLDGINMLPLVNGTGQERQEPVAFRSRKQRALMDKQFKLYSSDEGQTYELYDLAGDPYETKNLAGQYPGKIREMAAQLEAWMASCKESDQGMDYH